MIDFAGTSLTPEDRELLQNQLVGGVILFSRNYTTRDQVRELTAEIRSVREAHASRAPLLIAVDQEGGRVQRFREGFTDLPPLRWLGRMYDQSPKAARDMAHLLARLMATEVLDTGVDYSFAPVVDIDWGLCEVIGDRSLHREPSVVAELSLAYMQGMRQAGMAAVAKHFPAHGGVTGDSHHVLPEDQRSYTELTDDLLPYSSLIRDGLQGVMMAHIRYTGIEPQIASLSPYWMNTVLRQELGFKGAIFSDDLSMQGATVGGTVTDRTTTALQAGADMALVCNDRDSIAPIISALQGYSDPAAHARLAGMRVNHERYAKAVYGSDNWKRDMETLQAAVQAPPEPFKLDGNV
ncbi:MAG: beta-N-acetylhexosaminidase [Gammaproteobacteria bacterium]|nr:beta-N-acetylhexosaminidase [Gammaproteobacteria bacterium]MCP4832133.1 beta-N-acetylhexosaminidase [Gammaproteobacteria bacterium]